ncbi:DNA polymerase processivity subunit [Saimiriine betaherpesvirus 4]|uniref:DNA polymerase processivity factor n=1 Tax=Saimiriine betaherpesvirus 4 TaxID=1535247 RepID=G8XSV8_9BETA|nr:DNA polymerase processivity subunit [Saimiriine betaherpesvirus 4]AEV80904.1 DNA polymerase processivity subunit [Saimiriine betaherpesvirus 4]
MERKVRSPEPPTLALRLKPYKTAIQQLRSIIRTLKENTTVTFLPTPALVLQTVRNYCVAKITFNSSCLYITDKTFQPKTINNVTPLLGNFMYLTSSKDLTKFYIQDMSDLSAKICMCAPDFNMEFSSACVHGQDIIRESENSSVHVDFDFGVVTDLVKWLAPHTRVKRNVKKSPSSAGTVQILVHASPPVIKFVLSSGNELEFTANNRVCFHGVKNIRLNVQIKNLYQALMNCAVTKLPCTLRIMTEHDTMLYVASKNGLFCVENFLTEEPFQRNDLNTFEKNYKRQMANNVSLHEDGMETEAPPEMVPSKKHDRASRKSVEADHSAKEKYDQHKITNYMTSKSGGAGSSDRGPGYFGDAKEESDSDESVTFEFVPNAKKQKCT